MEEPTSFHKSSNSGHSMGSLSPEQWVVEVKESVRKTLESDGFHDIYGCVPKSLKNENTDIFYVPQAISFGPHHFGRKSPLRHEIEVLKSEVARKYDNRQNGFLETVVQIFELEDTQKRIRKIYSKEFLRDIGDDVLSWMMARDGCFLLEILEEFSKVENGKSNGQERQNSTTARIDRILDRRRYHPLLNDIVKDMFKMENQLPLWVLDVIVGERPKVWLAFKNLSPIEVNIEQGNLIYNGEHHMLHLLHDYMVDKMYQPLWRRGHPKSCLSVLSILKRILRIFTKALVLLVPSPVLILCFIWFLMCLIWDLIQACITDEAQREETHIPTLEELRKLGVKFKKLEGRGIYHIEFDESNSTLYLPKFKVDDRSEVILRNLMALEFYSDDMEKPITRYALLMNDLVNTSADVAILRKYNLITRKLGSDNDVAQFWNSVMVATEMPICNPIDKAASNINCYCKKRFKVLWNQFKMLHFSKPWMVLSMLGGTSLLMLTVVQVACLFRDCQYHRHND